MRAISTISLALFAAAVVAQSTSNDFLIPEGSSTYNVTAGGTVDLTWGNTEGGTVTIKLQTSSDIQPDSGIVLADSISNTGSTTVSIPSSDDIPSDGSYVFEIVNDDDTSEYNFSPSFSVSSASGTGSLAASTYTASNTASSSASGSSATAASTGSSASNSGTSSASAAATSSSAAASSSSSSTATSSHHSTVTPSVVQQTGGSATPSTASNLAWKKQAPFAAVVMIGAAAVL